MREKFVTITAPVGGIDLRVPSTLLDPRKSPFARNVYFRFGEVRKRWGRSQFSSSVTPIQFGGASATPIMRIDQLFKASGVDFLLAWSTTKVGKYNSGTDVFDNLTKQSAGVDVDFTGNQDNRFSVDYYDATDTFYWTNYVDTIQQWDGVAARASDLYAAATLRALVVRSFSNHLNFYRVVDAGTVAPRKVKWTDAGNTNLTGGTAGSTVLSGGSDFIIDALQLASKMAIYLERSIFTQEFVGGSTIYKFVPRIEGIGIYAQEAIGDLGGEHIILGSDLNVYTYDGGPDLNPIGDPIQSELVSIIDPTTGTRAYMIIVEELNEAWLLIVQTGKAQPDVVYAYNYIDKTWARHNLAHLLGALGFFRRTSTITWDQAVGSWDAQTARWDDRTFQANVPLLLGGSSVGKLTQFSQNTFDDDGVAMDVIFDTPDVLTPQDGGYTRVFRRYFDLNYEAKGTAVDVYYSTDEGVSYIFLETVTLTGAWTRYNTELDLVVQKARFRFRNTASGGQLQVRDIEVGYIERGIHE